MAKNKQKTNKQKLNTKAVTWTSPIAEEEDFETNLNMQLPNSVTFILPRQFRGCQFLTL